MRRVPTNEESLIGEWAAFSPGAREQLLPGDEQPLKRLLPEWAVTYSTWEEVITDPNIGARDSRLHLSLVPQPFIGDVLSAKAFILALNPGVHITDYYAEFQVPQFREAIAANLTRHFDPDFPHVFLNPRFAWHTGFSYWHGRLVGLISSFADELHICRREGLSYFARSFANIELLPYHSASFGLPSRTFRALKSVSLASRFVADHLVPKALSGEVVLVVTRQAALWSLPSHPNIVVYSGNEARAAYLTPRSRGGAAILAHLRQQWRNPA